MKLVILAVGRARATPSSSLSPTGSRGCRRAGALSRSSPGFPPAAGRTGDEGDRLLRHVPDGMPLIACDPRGRDTSSEALAAMLERYRDEGMATAYFAIGGADGHADGVLDRAESRIAFGSATWPHMLFRAMLAEQLYRAMMILAGHPYHRGG